MVMPIHMIRMGINFIDFFQEVEEQFQFNMFQAVNHILLSIVIIKHINVILFHGFKLQFFKKLRILSILMHIQEILRIL